MKQVLQIAGGILIAAGIIVATHEGWASYRWASEARVAGKKLRADDLNIDDTIKGIDNRLSEQEYINREWSKPNPYSWLFH
jgi:hypothetical protein